MRDAADQLRRYGDALERWLLERTDEVLPYDDGAQGEWPDDGWPEEDGGWPEDGGWAEDGGRPGDEDRVAGDTPAELAPVVPLPALAGTPGPARAGRDGPAGSDGPASHRGRWRRPGVVIAALATVAAVVLGAMALWPDGGAGDDVRTRPRADRRTTPSIVPTTAGTSAPVTTTSGAAPRQPTARTPTAPADRVRPGPDTTGPTHPDALVPVTGEEVEAMMRPGAVIEDVAITGGNVDVVADDVTIRNFRLDGAGATFGFRSCGADGDCGTQDDQATGFVAEDGEVLNVTSAAFWGRHATVRRLDVHDSDTAAFKPVSDVTIEASWWHHLGRGGGGANGVQFLSGGGDIRVRGNFCDLPLDVPAPYGSSACVMTGSNTEPTLSAVIEGNWFNGGNMTVECTGHTGVAVRDNRFGRDHRYGPLSRCPTASGNVWDDTGQPL